MHFPVKLIVDNNNNHRYPQKDEQLRAAYASALKLARDNGLRRVGCSLISAGIFSGARGLDNIMSISWQVRSLLRLSGIRMPFTAPLVWCTHAVHCSACLVYACVMTMSWQVRSLLRLPGVRMHGQDTRFVPDLLGMCVHSVACA
jgi:hypothetical protein